MRRLWPLVLLFAGCATFDDYDSFSDGGFYQQPMPMQQSFAPQMQMPTATASCGGCGSSQAPVHQAGFQTGEPPIMKQTAEPPK